MMFARKCCNQHIRRGYPNHCNRLRFCTRSSTVASALTCKRCFRTFEPAENKSKSCKYHNDLWTGGEVAKAVGFVRKSDAPEDQLVAVIGKRGLLRFWDCCGAGSEDAPGCKVGYHITFDEEYNQQQGWQ